MDAAIHVLQYLKGTLDVGIRFRGPLLLIGAVDADWAADLDERKSTTGWVFTLADGAVSWRSCKQHVTALSSTDSEVIAASDGTQEAIWLRRLLVDLGYTQSDPTPILEDNEATIKLSRNRSAPGRTKHIDVRHFFVRERTTTGEVKLMQVRTYEQPADMFTKALSRYQLASFYEDIGLVSIGGTR
jgi:hypothetical protein